MSDVDPDRKPGSARATEEITVPGYLAMNPATAEMCRRPLGPRHRGDQQDEPDRDELQEVEPFASPDAHAGGHAVRGGERSRPPLGVDGVLAKGEAVPVGSEHLRRGRRFALTRIPPSWIERAHSRACKATRRDPNTLDWVST
jgi:hypothetical protein